MAYKWENGKIRRVSLPKKVSKKNKELLEKYSKTDTSYKKELEILKNLNIKTVYGY